MKPTRSMKDDPRDRAPGAFNPNGSLVCTPFPRGAPPPPKRTLDPLLQPDRSIELAEDLLGPDPHAGHQPPSGPKLDQQPRQASKPLRSGTVMSAPFQFTEVYACSPLLSTIERGWNKGPLLRPDGSHIPVRNKWVHAIQVTERTLPRHHHSFRTDASGRIQGSPAQLPVVVNDDPCFYLFIVSRLPLEKFQLFKLCIELPELFPTIDLASAAVYTSLEGSTERLLPVCDPLSLLLNLHYEYERACLRLGIFQNGNGTPEDASRVEKRSQAYALAALIPRLEKLAPDIQDGLREPNMVELRGFIDEHQAMLGFLTDERERLARMLTAFSSSSTLALATTWYRGRDGAPKPECGELQRIRSHAMTRLSESEHGSRYLDQLIEARDLTWQMIMPSDREAGFDPRELEVMDKSGGAILDAAFELLPRWLWRRRTIIAAMLARRQATAAQQLWSQTVAQTQQAFASLAKRQAVANAWDDLMQALGRSPSEYLRDQLADIDRRINDIVAQRETALSRRNAARSRGNEAEKAVRELPKTTPHAELAGAWPHVQSGARGILLLLNALITALKSFEVLDKAPSDRKASDWLSIAGGFVDTSQLALQLLSKWAPAKAADRMLVGTRILSPLLLALTTCYDLERSRELDLELKQTGELMVLAALGGQVAMAATRSLLGLSSGVLVTTAVVGLAFLLAAGVLVSLLADESELAAFARHCYFGAKYDNPPDTQAPRWVVNRSWRQLRAAPNGLLLQLQSLLGLLMKFSVRGLRHDEIEITFRYLLPGTTIHADFKAMQDGKQEETQVVLDHTGRLISCSSHHRVQLSARRGEHRELSTISIRLLGLPPASRMSRRWTEQVSCFVYLKQQLPGVSRSLTIPWTQAQQHYALVSRVDDFNYEPKGCFDESPGDAVNAATLPTRVESTQ